MNTRMSAGICVAVSLVFGYLCISSHAPMIESEVATRCREALAAHQIKPDGLTVNGRDVLLMGSEGAPIVSEPTRILMEHVTGVRAVKIQIANGEAGSSAGAAKPEEPQDARVRAVQEMINGILQNQPIEFKPDSPNLTPQSRVVLDSLASILAHAQGLRCEIRGNSKAPSNAQHEWMMTLQRALATEDYLVSKGIADWRLSAQVFHAGTGSPEGDRQIEFVVKER